MGKEANRRKMKWPQICDLCAQKNRCTHFSTQFNVDTLKYYPPKAWHSTKLNIRDNSLLRQRRALLTHATARGPVLGAGTRATLAPQRPFEHGHRHGRNA